MEGTPWTSDRIVMLLERAGATLLSLPNTGCHPAGFRVAWPDFARAATEAYGYQHATRRPARPSAQAITEMDYAFSLVQLIPADRRVARRIVLMRALVYPISERVDPHVWSWRRLGNVIGADPRSVRAWHAAAILQILRRLQNPGLCAKSGGAIRTPDAWLPSRSREIV